MGRRRFKVVIGLQGILYYAEIVPGKILHEYIGCRYPDFDGTMKNDMLMENFIANNVEFKPIKK